MPFISKLLKYTWISSFKLLIFDVICFFFYFRDREIYVTLFAKRIIRDSNVVDHEWDGNTHHIKFDSLLWKYGKMKLEKHITNNESESS